jgi:O-antigen ligase
VLGGRPQVYGAILGIMDRPILGFGSWRHDLTGVYVVDAFTDVGSDPKIIDSIAKTGFAPGAGHSVLFQAWVENGLVPALCWLMIAGIIFKVSLYNIKNNTIYTAFFVITLVAFFWTFLFSPPPVSFRYLVGFYMAYFVVFMDKRRPLRNAAEIV